MTSNNNSGAGALAGAAGVNSANSATGNPMALKTEMNKVDVIVDGRSVAGMYQVVHHRYETISTTTAVVPRTADDPHHHQVGTLYQSGAWLAWVQWVQLHPQILRLTTSAPTIFCKIIGKFW